MALLLDRTPQNVGDLHRQLNELRRQVDEMSGLLSIFEGAVVSGVSIADLTGATIARITNGEGATYLEIIAGDHAGALTIADGYLSLSSSTEPTVVSYGPGYAFADIPFANLGDVLVVTNSSTTTWGATIAAASPGDPVLAHYNGTNWTVIGK